MLDEAPEGWRHAKFGEIAAISGGTTPSKTEASYWVEGVIPWATPSDITSLSAGQNRISATAASVAEIALKNCSLKLNPPGTVLMTSRATIGYAAINDVPMTTNQGFLNFTCSDLIDSEFLCQWLNAKRGQLTAAAGGSTFRELSRGTAKLLPIFLPPLEEQQQIAQVLRSIDKVILTTEKILVFCRSLLTNLRRSTFKHLIANADDKSLRLGEICEVGRGFAFKSESYVDDGVLNFRVTNVGKPIYELGELRHLPDRFLDVYKDYVLAGGEIVLVMVGATVGKLGRIPSEVCPALLNQNIWTLTAKQPFNQELLWHLVHVIVEEKVYNAQGGAYSFLTKKDFLQHRVSDPNISTIGETMKYLSALEQYIEKLSVEARQYDVLKELLTCDLLSGRVRVLG